MNASRFLFGFFTMWLVQGQARASSPVVYTRKLDCGSFTVTAESTITKSVDRAVQEQSPRQWIRLVNPARHLAVTLNLRQHRSPDKALGGRLGLDGIAYEWSCAHTPNAGDFLLVQSFCSQDDAKTCATAMDIPSSEWSQVFDAAGNPLFRHPPSLTDAEEARLHRLGVWHSFQYLADDKHVQFIYPLDGSP